MAMGQRQAALLQQAASPGIIQPIPVPAPVKGWNTRDPFENMDPQDAVTMDNMQPDYGGVIPREGSQIYDQHASVPSSPVTSLLVWRSGNQTQLLAAGADRIWRVGQTADLGTGFGSAWWSGVMFNGKLFLANGRDPLQVYDGTTLAPAAFAVDPSPPAGSAIYPPFNLSTIVGLAVAHNLLFMWDGHSPGFWYTSVPYAITGAVMHWFPFDMVTPDGANLVGVQTLTYDGGQGIMSYACFFLSSAEMLIYSGTNPDIPLSSSTTGWSLQGIYTVAQPAFGETTLPRAMCRYGGDVYMISSTDYVKLSQVIAGLKEGVVPPRSKASGACLAATSQGRTLDGWQIVYWGGGRRLIVNVPLVAPDPAYHNANFEQHVYNTGLDAWCRYRGLNAYCWATWDDQIFFGTVDGIVKQFGTATGDEQPDTTQFPVDAFTLQAWGLMGTAHNKQVAAVKPVIRSAAAVYYEFGIGFDYNVPDTPIAVQHFGSRTPWNTTPWGTPWERPTETDSLWYVAGGDGAAISIGMHLLTNNEDTWVWSRTDYRVNQSTAL